MQEIALNEDNGFSMTVRLEKGVDSIELAISDDLDSAYERITLQQQQRIWRFLDQSDIWLTLAEERIREEFPGNTELILVVVRILSELSDEDLVYGLQFWVSKDIEHGRGVKMREGDFSIIDYGTAEVSLFA